MKDVADLLRVSLKYVLNIFSDYPGVVDLSTYLVKRGKRRKRCFRIPRHVLERFLNGVGSGPNRETPRST
jgi:hypothetical protein